jgi:replicative DNA helicase
VCREVMDPAAAGAEEFIPTGIESLDAQIGGWLRGGKHLIGGKAGMGKSALMKQAALNCAAAGRTVGFISVEESRRKVIRNMLANLADVPNNRLAFRTLYPTDHAKVEAASERLSGMPLHVVDAARKLTEISAAVHRLAVEKGAEVIFVDHLHLIDGETDDNREREISKISAELKVLWRRLNVAGVEAAQLNRKGGRDRPGMENLRDSGSLEFDSDVILLLHREDYYNRTEPSYTPDKILECNIAKNKDGATAILPLGFDESRLMILNRADDLPHRVNQRDGSEGAFD